MDICQILSLHVSHNYVDSDITPITDGLKFIKNTEFTMLTSSNEIKLFNSQVDLEDFSEKFKLTFANLADFGHKNMVFTGADILNILYGHKLNNEIIINLINVSLETANNIVSRFSKHIGYYIATVDNEYLILETNSIKYKINRNIFKNVSELLSNSNVLSNMICYDFDTLNTIPYGVYCLVNKINIYLPDRVHSNYGKKLVSDFDNGINIALPGYAIDEFDKKYMHYQMKYLGVLRHFAFVSSGFDKNKICVEKFILDNNDSNVIECIKKGNLDYPRKRVFSGEFNYELLVPELSELFVSKHVSPSDISSILEKFNSLLITYKLSPLFRQYQEIFETISEKDLYPEKYNNNKLSEYFREKKNSSGPKNQKKTLEASTDEDNDDTNNSELVFNDLPKKGKNNSSETDNNSDNNNLSKKTTNKSDESIATTTDENKVNSHKKTNAKEEPDVKKQIKSTSKKEETEQEDINSKKVQKKEEPNKVNKEELNKGNQAKKPVPKKEDTVKGNTSKKSNSKKENSSSESEEEPVSKKNIKKQAQKKNSKNDSDSESESEENNSSKKNPKKQVTKKNTKVTTATDSDSEEEDKTKKKKNIKKKTTSSTSDSSSESNEKFDKKWKKTSGEIVLEAPKNAPKMNSKKNGSESD